MYQPSKPTLDVVTDPITDPRVIAVASTSEAPSSARAALPGPRLHCTDGDITAVLMQMAQELHVLSPRGAMLVAWAHSQWPDSYGAYFNAHCRPRILWRHADLDAAFFDAVYAPDDDTVEHIPEYRLPALVAVRSATTTRLNEENRLKPYMDTPALLTAVSAPSQPQTRSPEFHWFDQDIPSRWERFWNGALLALLAFIILGALLLVVVGVVYLLVCVVSVVQP